MTSVLIDPQLAEFNADHGQPEQHSHDAERDLRLAQTAVELGAAFLVVRHLVSTHLSQTAAAPGSERQTARDAWIRYAPIWMRLALPAVRAAIASRVDVPVEPAQLEAAAVDYCTTLGEYLNETNADALAEGFGRQLGSNWSEGLAWRRAAAGYGLDRRQMASWITGVLRAAEMNPTDPVPAASRSALDAALLARADRIGAEETLHAAESGKALAWLVAYQAGVLPVGTVKRWNCRHEHTCAQCSPLHEQEVAPDQPFTMPDGTKVWSPTLHPGCNCHVHLVVPVVGGAGPVGKAYDPSKHPRGNPKNAGEFAAKPKPAKPRPTVKDRVRDPVVDAILEQLRQVQDAPVDVPVTDAPAVEAPVEVDAPAEVTAPVEVDAPAVPLTVFQQSAQAQATNVFAQSAQVQATNVFAQSAQAQAANVFAESAQAQAAAKGRLRRVEGVNPVVDLRRRRRGKKRGEEVTNIIVRTAKTPDPGRMLYLRQSDIRKYLHDEGDGQLPYDLDIADLNDYYRRQSSNFPGVHAYPYLDRLDAAGNVDGGWLGVADWQRILKEATPLWNHVLQPEAAYNLLFTQSGSLNDVDVRNILTRAGYAPSTIGSPDGGRARILTHVRQKGTSAETDDSLWSAYADYTVFNRPDLLGKPGAEFDTLMETLGIRTVLQGTPRTVVAFPEMVPPAADKGLPLPEVPHTLSNAHYTSAINVRGFGGPIGVVGVRHHDAFAEGFNSRS